MYKKKKKTFLSLFLQTPKPSYSIRQKGVTVEGGKGDTLT